MGAKRFLGMAMAMVLAAGVSGCAMMDKSRRADFLERENASLRDELAALREKRGTDLEQARKDLARAFEKELGEYKAKLEMTERGLVLTFLAEVFFNSGMAEVRPQGKEVLDKVAKVLREDVPDSRVAIEGHTDSDPIVRSNWLSNWELSTARALAALHYFIDEDKVPATQLSVAGYGEYRPVASNDTAEGKKKNRRVEIVILPSKLEKVKADK